MARMNWSRFGHSGMSISGIPEYEKYSSINGIPYGTKIPAQYFKFHGPKSRKEFCVTCEGSERYKCENENHTFLYECFYATFEYNKAENYITFLRGSVMKTNFTDEGRAFLDAEYKKAHGRKPRKDGVWYYFDSKE